jgi:putative nucleotidyltransferase with HDIG domain
VSPRILIAENDCDARGQLAGWLEQAGYVCTQATADEALSAVRRQMPDAAVVGVTVPDEGGMFVVRTLRSQAAQVGVVVVSTPPDFDVAVAASRLGAVDCLPWPTSSDGVVSAVRRAVDWRSATRAAEHAHQQLLDEIARGRETLKQTIRRVDPETAPTVLLAVLEARSPETFDHSQRVARAAVALAHSCRVPQGDVATLRRAALLHDIGKIAVPDRLLRGTGPISQGDLAILRTHVTVGQQVLSSVPLLRPTADIVGATHEKYDGTGYPGGLTGEHIPFAARLIAVADAYDAMTAVRSYNDPVTHEEANAELVRTAGGHFDPDVVRAWLQMTELRNAGGAFQEAGRRCS